jgi:hypothetical protein
VELPPGSHAYRIVVDGEQMLDEFNLHRREAVGELGVNLVEVPAPAPAPARVGANAIGERGR